MMKALIASVVAVAAVSTAMPAAAQGWARPGFAPHNGGDAMRIERQIEMGARNGSLTRGEVNSLRRQLQDIRQIEWRYARNGVSAREARELDRRYAELSARLRFERRDGQDNRGYGYGYGRGDGWR